MTSSRASVAWVWMLNPRLYCLFLTIISTGPLPALSSWHYLLPRSEALTQFSPWCLIFPSVSNSFPAFRAWPSLPLPKSLPWLLLSSCIPTALSCPSAHPATCCYKAGNGERESGGGGGLERAMVRSWADWVKWINSSTSCAIWASHWSSLSLCFLVYKVGSNNTDLLGVGRSED